MFAVEQLALRVLPIVVLVYASLAMIGGAFHLAKEAAPQDSVAKAGLGLCAVSFAFFVKKARGAALPQVPAGRPAPESLPLGAPFGHAFRAPSSAVHGSAVTSAPSGLAHVSPAGLTAGLT